MANIQQGINQILGMGATFSKISEFSPEAAEQRENERLGNVLDTAKAEKERLSKTIKDPKTSDKDRAAATKTVEYLEGQIEGSRKRLFELNPSRENLGEIEEGFANQEKNKKVIKKGYENASREAEEQGYQEMMQQAYQEGIEQYDDQRANTAMQRAQRQAKSRAKRRNFVRDYLSQMQTSMGGTVGELPPEIQKVIASNYSSKERRQIMNQQDREKNQGGNK